ncbi:MAG: efflux RND transporter periplasmic adaptor subunit [Candidatus Magnetomorum sp.]|nr:efflux RND transporter periplasmic adaptor subunit [Candidatus Magnetomorum sp.]
MRSNLLIVVFFLFWVAGCGNDAPTVSQENIRPVKVLRIQVNDNQERMNTFSGIAKGIHESVLSFRVPGVLQQLTAKVGDHVKKGQIVAALDRRDFQLRVDDMTNRLNSAQAQLEQLQKGARSEDLQIIDQKINAINSALKTTRTEYNRVQKLYAADAASKSQLDTARTELDRLSSELNSAQQERTKGVSGGREEEVRSARADIRSIRSNLDQAKANLEDTQLKIPFDGIISQKHIANYQQINMGQSIYTLVDITRIEIQISVPERRIANVSPGQSVDVEFLNFSDKQFSGTISKVGVTADHQTLTYPVFVEVANPGGSVLPGMSTRVTVKTQLQKQAYPVIPIHAILEDKITGARYIWIYDPQSQTAKRRDILLAGIVRDDVEVIKGLVQDDIVIVAGVNRVREGMKVRVVTTNK